ncbi:hypothetical protein [Methyloversatilis sp.]|uniref:hypothetical protein n=1 Tax=Methyloversatilis sp. TaxID=2569862 RepID=UPI0027B91581|nr:hypothetical protein [Methyloversatilis sp.]
MTDTTDRPRSERLTPAQRSVLIRTILIIICLLANEYACITAAADTRQRPRCVIQPVADA